MSFRCIFGCSDPPTYQQKVFIFFLSILVMLQQALSSGYIDSVITSIKKCFKIPSRLSGLIASSYELGNIIFVFYLSSRRHIPVWIAVGIIVGASYIISIVVQPFFVESKVCTYCANPNVLKKKYPFYL